MKNKRVGLKRSNVPKKYLIRERRIFNGNFKNSAILSNDTYLGN